MCLQHQLVSPRRRGRELFSAVAPRSRHLIRLEERLLLVVRLPRGETGGARVDQGAGGGERRWKATQGRARGVDLPRGALVRELLVGQRLLPRDVELLELLRKVNTGARVAACAHAGRGGEACGARGACRGGLRR